MYIQDIYVYVYTYIYTHTYSYTHISQSVRAAVKRERARARERERERESERMHTAKAICGEANAMKRAAKKDKAFTKKAAICANILCTAAFAAATVVTFPQSTRIHHSDFFLRHMICHS